MSILSLPVDMSAKFSRIASLAVVGALLMAGQAHALSFTFSDEDYLGGASWGTMDISVFDANSLQVDYTASTALPSGSQATGFGFAFASGDLASVTNPANNASAVDQDNLTWLELTKVKFPTPSNADEFSPTLSKSDFDSGATEVSRGSQNNINPPGIYPGQSDTLYLNFDGAPTFTDPSFDLGGFVDLTGVRLQALPCDIKGGSLFLASDTPTTPVPEPGTLLLLGSGLFGLGVLGRRRKS